MNKVLILGLCLVVFVSGCVFWGGEETQDGGLLAPGEITPDGCENPACLTQEELEQINQPINETDNVENRDAIE